MKVLKVDSAVDFPVTPSQPQFDDERTILSARPVVPLEKIDARLRYRRRWFLGGAFAIAMLLGAASALVASYLKLRNVPSATAEASNEGGTPAPLAVVVSASTDPLTDTPADFETEPAATAIPPPKVATSRRMMRRTPARVEPGDPRQLSEEDQLHQIREAVLFDEWQERRARRAARRERRRLERYNQRDLSNLDEIFEGPRRPGQDD